MLCLVIMGQVETKVFQDAPPWDEESVRRRTDLSEATVDLCWKIWRKSEFVRHGKLRLSGFESFLGIESASEREHARRLFQLLDRDENQKIGR